MVTSFGLSGPIAGSPLGYGDGRVATSPIGEAPGKRCGQRAARSREREPRHLLLVEPEIAQQFERRRRPEQVERREQHGLIEGAQAKRAVAAKLVPG